MFCFKAVTDCMHFALHNLSNALKPAVNTTYLNVPEPLVASDSQATVLFPWRAFISRFVVRLLFSFLLPTNLLDRLCL
jgi:hypothetical protein